MHEWCKLFTRSLIKAKKNTVRKSGRGGGEYSPPAPPSPRPLYEYLSYGLHLLFEKTLNWSAASSRLDSSVGRDVQRKSHGQGFKSLSRLTFSGLLANAWVAYLNAMIFLAFSLKLERLPTWGSNYQGRTSEFSSVILKLWVLVRPHAVV